MTKIILTVALLLPFTLFAGECNLEQSIDEFDSPIAYMDESYDDNIGIGEKFEREIAERLEKLNRYEKKLNKFLASSSDINIQLSSVNSFVENNINLTKIKPLLKEAIHNSSDKYTLYLADNICHSNQELKQWCHKQKIHEIHYLVDPENLFTYLFDLHEDGDLAKIHETIINAAENSIYAESFYYHYIIEQSKYIDDFNALNPAAFNDYIGTDDPNHINEFDFMDEKIIELQLIEKGLVSEDYKESIYNNHSIIYSLGKEMAKSYSIGHIIKYCENIEIADYCLSIAKHMINEKTTINRLFGSAIYNSAKSALGDDSNDELSSKIEKTNKDLVCYSQFEDTMYAQYLNKDLMIQYIQDINLFGEAEAAKKFTLKVYNIEKQHGFNPTFHPNDCQ